MVLLATACLPALAADGGGIVIQNGNFTATKISNPTNGSGQPDGIEPGGDRDNSYAFSMGQDEDNIYLGVNRTMVWSSIMADPNYMNYAPLLEAFTLGELPPANFGDRAARLFMIDKETHEVKLAYKAPISADGSPYDTGYRGAKANFQSASSDTVSYYFGTTGPKFSRILRIDPGYDPATDQPTEVFRINGRVTIRAMEVHNGQLTIGVTLTDGTTAIYAASDPDAGADAWTRIGFQDDLFVPGQYDDSDVAFENYVSNLYTYNGWLYVGISGGSRSSFLIYKGKFVGIGVEGANQAGWLWKPIVAPEGKYKDGLGDSFSVSPTFAPYVDENGKEWTYVSTMSDTFYPLFKAIAGDYSGLYEAVQHPTELFRFDENDNWEMVMGDPARHNGYFGEPLSGYYDGYSKENDKLNMQSYTWYITAHEGEIYAGTYNAATWLRYVTIGIDNDKLNDLVHYTDEQRDQFLNDILGNLGGLTGGKINLTPAQITQIQGAAKILFRLLQNIDCAQASNRVQEITTQIFNAFNTFISQFDKFLPDGTSAVSLVENSSLGHLYKFVALCSAVASTERGFSLYRTVGGIQLEAITTNGFNDEYNYGIRNLVSTPQGLYVGTANPFYGCQLWLLTQEEQSDPAGQGGSIADSLKKIFSNVFLRVFDRISKFFGQYF